MIEANPRASRTVPFVAKATGVPLAKVAARVMIGRHPRRAPRARGCCADPVVGDHVAVKEAVLPFSRFPESDAAARPGDALHRRGHGHRPHGRAGVRQEPAGGRDPAARRRAPCSCRWPTGTRPPGCGRRRGSASWASTSPPPPAPPPTSGPRASTSTSSWPSSASPRATTPSSSSRAARVDLVVNSPRGRGPRADGAHIRAAAGHPPGPAAHHGGRRPGGGQRHGRLGPPRPAGAAAAGVPPRRRRRAAGAPRVSVAATPVADARRRAPHVGRPAAPDGAPVDLAHRRSVRVALANPVMTASGTAGHGDELAAYVDLSRLGAVVVKSLSAEPWAGNPAPRVHETPAGMINSVGLQGPGVRAWLDDELPAVLATGATVVASIWGRTVEDYRPGRRAAGRGARPRWWRSRSTSRARTTTIATACSPTRRRPRPRRSPRRSGVRSAHVGQAQPQRQRPGVHRGRGRRTPGPRPWSLVNTVLGMAIDPETRRPRLGGGGGGLSGPAIHPVAVRAVHDVHAALPELPIVGVGGVARGVDAVELLLAGARRRQVGHGHLRRPPQRRARP